MATKLAKICPNCIKENLIVAKFCEDYETALCNLSIKLKSSSKELKREFNMQSSGNCIIPNCETIMTDCIGSLKFKYDEKIGLLRY